MRRQTEMEEQVRDLEQSQQTRRSGFRLPKLVPRGIAEFIRTEVAGSVILLIATISALILANSALVDTYLAILETPISFAFNGFVLEESLLHWINDGLMTLFFFVVGLEIKRELLVGELASPRKALLPVMAALGGMLAPALIYVLINWGGPGYRGWGVPMATDIAFALGVMALLGSRVPVGLKVFLAALAIVDDIGAVLVIALFYTGDIHWNWLIFGGLVLLLILIFNLLEVQRLAAYAVPALLVWLAFFESGVHATIAGVLVALLIPGRAMLAPVEFVAYAREQLDVMERIDVPGAHVLDNDDQQQITRSLRNVSRSVEAPLQRLEHALHPYSTYLVLPLFALANAGIVLGGINPLDLLFQPVTLGVIAGLVLGKQLGITLMAWLVVKLGLSELPNQVTWRQVYGAAWLSGIGFTMSLFVAGLAFIDPLLLAEAKIGILAASLLSGLMGYILLRTAK